MSESQLSKNPVRRYRWLLIALPLVGLVAASVVTARGHQFGFQARHGMLDAESAKKHVEFVTGWILKGIDADQDQTENIQGVLEKAVDELAPIGIVHRGNRDRIHAELLSPTVDRQTLEEIRQAELALADDASRIFINAIADVAEQLSEEQKMELIEQFHQFHD